MNDSAIAQLARTSLGELTTKHAKQLSAAADTEQTWLLDGIALQQCEDCQHCHYPAQALCPNCLSDNLSWKKKFGHAKLISFTHLHISFNGLYQAQTPWTIGMVEQSDGAVLFAFLKLDSPAIGDSVQLFSAPDITGQGVIIAVDDDDSALQNAEQLAKNLILTD